MDLKAQIERLARGAHRIAPRDMPGDPTVNPDAYLAASDGFAPRGMEDPSKDPQWTAVTHSAAAVRILSHDRVVHIRLTRDLK